MYADTLKSFPKHEVTDMIVESAKASTDNENEFNALQFQSGLKHWKIMRNIFPSEFWMEF